jgi:hypothetical protein
MAVAFTTDGMALPNNWTVCGRLRVLALLGGAAGGAVSAGGAAFWAAAAVAKAMAITAVTRRARTEWMSEAAATLQYSLIVQMIDNAAFSPRR